MDKKIIEIDGIEYVRKDSIDDFKEPEKLDGMDYVVVRTYSAGAWIGYLEKRNGREVSLKNATRLYYWAGAFTLSQLAKDGVSKPEECKFPVAVDVLLLEAIEIIPATEKAKKSIEKVKIWNP